MLKQAAAALAFATLILTGCQENSYSSTRQAREEFSQDDIYGDASRDGARLLAELQAYVARNPLDYDAIAGQVYEIEAAAPDTPSAEAARKILVDVKAEYDAAAEREYRRVIDRARDLADIEFYDRALMRLEDFARKFPGSKATGSATEERLKISKAREAKSSFEVFVHNVDSFRAVNEYESVLEYIEKRKPKSLEGTPYQEKHQEYLAKFTAEAESFKGQKARENALPWENLPAGENSWRSHGGDWNVANGRIRGKHDGEDFGRLMMGRDDWKDYVIDMQFTLARGEFHLGVRGVRTSGYSHSYKLMDVCYGIQDTNQPVSMKLTARGDMVTIESPSLPGPRYVKITERDGSFKHSYGPICIFLNSGTEVEFTRLRVKHLERVTEPTARR